MSIACECHSCHFNNLEQYERCLSLSRFADNGVGLSFARCVFLNHSAVVTMIISFSYIF